MNFGKEFKKFAVKDQGISSLHIDQLVSSVTPYIIEERQLNVAQMDVFSRLMMDRIIFLGTAIDDYVANIIQAQLLFLESVDSSKDISIYINSHIITIISTGYMDPGLKRNVIGMNFIFVNIKINKLSSIYNV